MRLVNHPPLLCGATTLFSPPSATTFQLDEVHLQVFNFDATTPTSFRQGYQRQSTLLRDGMRQGGPSPSHIFLPFPTCDILILE